MLTGTANAIILFKDQAIEVQRRHDFPTYVPLTSASNITLVAVKGITMAIAGYQAVLILVPPGKEHTVLVRGNFISSGDYGARICALESLLDNTAAVLEECKLAED